MHHTPPFNATVARQVAMSFSYDAAADRGRVLGGGWDQRYEGFGDVFAAWGAANRDGFYLRPHARFEPDGVTPVMRAAE